ncbi:hypothetical protein QAD02_014380 [Eretmocerus hayati]|uniref:Uncharacterized protein n=1 Tax=Eretmocerus hayati TaxID=131215 RepID=A0ACC2P545_9HYME|nr:hypothetical protein QAD02_014380 [Eretmocerus hayati]
MDANDKRRLNLIGQTRWWAKYSGLTKVFGSSESSEKSLYVVVIVVLETIENDPRSKSDVRVNARSYRESLLKKETVLTAFIFLTIFDVTTHLPNYLQTKVLNILKASNMIKTTLNRLKSIRDDFELVKAKAEEFIKLINDRLEAQNVNSHM